MHISIEKLNLDADPSQVLNLQLHGMEQLDDSSCDQLTAVSGLGQHHGPDREGDSLVYRDGYMGKQCRGNTRMVLLTWLGYHICHDHHI